MYEHTLSIQFFDEKYLDHPILNNASGLMAKEYEFGIPYKCSDRGTKTNHNTSSPKTG
jgi:hypothetical protein